MHNKSAHVNVLWSSSLFNNVMFVFISLKDHEHVLTTVLDECARMIADAMHVK